jgi:hypothetical protein
VNSDYSKVNQIAGIMGQYNIYGSVVYFV